MNERTYTLNLSSIQICDLLLACLNAELHFESAQRWALLHDALKEQFKSQDEAAFQQKAEVA